MDLVFFVFDFGSLMLWIPYVEYPRQADLNYSDLIRISSMTLLSVSEFDLQEHETLERQHQRSLPYTWQRSISIKETLF